MMKSNLFEMKAPALKSETVHYGFTSDESVLRELFIEYLLPVYYANAHLSERLTEMTDEPKFEDLYTAIKSSVKEVNSHLERVSNLFELIGSTIDMNEYDKMATTMENAFSSIHKIDNDTFHRDLAILYYLQSASNIEETCYKMLDVISSKINNLHIKLINIENHQQAKVIKALPLLLQKRYFNLF